jgi:hypothetical protein
MPLKSGPEFLRGPNREQVVNICDLQVPCHNVHILPWSRVFAGLFFL